jgi:hypothetical protein
MYRGAVRNWRSAKEAAQCATVIRGEERLTAPEEGRAASHAAKLFLYIKK